MHNYQAATWQHIEHRTFVVIAKCWIKDVFANAPLTDLVRFVILV